MTSPQRTLRVVLLGLLACITAASKQAAVEVVMPAAAPQQATAAGLITHPKTGIAAIAAPVAAFLGRSTAALAAAAAAVPSAAASTRAPVEVVMPEAAPQQAGLLLPTSAAYGSLPAASALPAVPAPRAAALPATAAFPSTAVPAATQQPLPAAGIYQPVQQSRPTLAAQSAPGLALPAGVPMSAAPQTYQPFPAASSGLTAAANPGFPPMAPGGFGALPAAYSGPLPGDGVMGRGGPAAIPGVTPAGDKAAAGSGLGSLMDTSMYGSGSSSSSSSIGGSSSGGSSLGMGGSIGDPFSGSGTLGGGSSALGGPAAGGPGGANNGLGGTMRSRRAATSAAQHDRASIATVVAGLLVAAVLVL